MATELCTRRSSLINQSEGSKVDLKQDDEKLFRNMFTQLLHDVTNNENVNKHTAIAYDYYKKAAEYNVPVVEKRVGVMFVHYYRHLVGDEVTEEGLRLASVLAWCGMWLVAVFNVSDDIADNGTINLGKPCWYLKSEVGLGAIYDCIHMENSLYFILRKYLKGKECYTDILELFHEITYLAITGQTMDVLVAKEVNFTSYTMEYYEELGKQKYGHLLYLPAACAMLLARLRDKELFEQVKNIKHKLGAYLQSLNDFNDCFGDRSVCGRLGCDIDGNRCTWLIVKALTMVSPYQRAILQDNYGRKDSESVSKVIDLYKQLDLASEFRKYKEQCFAEVYQLIDELKDETPKKMLLESTAWLCNVKSP